MGLDQAAGWTTNHEPLTEDEKVVKLSTENDDVREFDGTRGYLSIDGLKAELDGLAKGRQFYHLDDIFRWHM